MQGARKEHGDVRTVRARFPDPLRHEASEVDEDSVRRGVRGTAGRRTMGARSGQTSVSAGGKKVSNLGEKELEVVATKARRPQLARGRSSRPLKHACFGKFRPPMSMQCNFDSACWRPYCPSVHAYGSKRAQKEKGVDVPRSEQEEQADDVLMPRSMEHSSRSSRSSSWSSFRTGDSAPQNLEEVEEEM